MAKSLNARPTTNSRPSKSISGGVSRTAPQQRTPQSGKTFTAPTISKPVAPATIKANEQAATSQNDVSAKSELFATIRNMVAPFAYVNENVWNENVELAGGKGMSVDDRTISYECAEYVVSNLAYIFMGLVLDEAFKDTFLECLSIELKFDEQTDDKKKKMREGMKDKKSYASAGSIVLGVTNFSPAIEKDLMDKMSKGFDALDRYAGEFNEAVAKLSEERKIEYGLIFSNFMYLIRAFTHNDLFMSYVVTVIERVKVKLADIEKA